MPLFPPPAQTATFGLGGKQSFIGASSSSALWPNRVDSGAGPFASAFEKFSTEKKQANGHGCRLFGIELVEKNSAPKCFSPVTVSGAAAVDQLVQSNEIDSNHQNEPIINQSDIPMGIDDPEKSSPMFPQDSQSKQIRSCTKVTVIS